MPISLSLVDLAVTISDCFRHVGEPGMVGESRADIARCDTETDRAVFSEFDTAGAVTGAFLIRKRRYKLIHYRGFEDELFDLEADPNGLVNLIGDSYCNVVFEDLWNDLRATRDPTEIELKAHANYRTMIDALGGLKAVRNLGQKGAPLPLAAVG